MKILVCGDRQWSDRQTIYRILLPYATQTPPVTIIHGGARGADTLAGQVAQELGMEVRAVRAEWQRYGRGAGPRRNENMFNEHPALVIAFHNDLAKSKGTADTVRKAQKRGIAVRVVTTREEEPEHSPRTEEGE